MTEMFTTEEVLHLQKAVAQLAAAIEHVIQDSPGTPDSVKGYLRAALVAASSEELATDLPEKTEKPKSDNRFGLNKGAGGGNRTRMASLEVLE